MVFERNGSKAWNVPQQVTVTSMIDEDGVSETAMCVHSTSSDDEMYSERDVDMVEVNVMDEDLRPLKLSLSTDHLNLHESTGDVLVEVYLDRVAIETTQVDLEVLKRVRANGNGSDYTLATANLTIEQGETRSSTTLTILDDFIDEDDETIVLSAKAASLQLSSSP